MAKSVIGTFTDKIHVEKALSYLTQEGYSSKDLSVLVSDKSRGRHFQIEQNTKAPEGATAGAVAGGAVGALVAGLTAVGTVASGGTLLAAGPLVASLAGLGAGGATGGLAGGLIGLGISENEAKLSSADVENGNILLGVNTEKDRIDKVKSIMESCEATHITTQS